MAISAQRFNYLDRETNVGVREFNNLTDNVVYTAGQDLVESALALAKDTEGLLNTLEGKMSDIESMINSTLEDAGSLLKDALNIAMDAISKIEMPSFVKKIFNSLKSLDLSGVKSFFKEALQLGSSFLCHNLDFLKNFLLGFSIDKNILSGLIIGLSLSWMDKFCKEATQQESSKASNREKIDMQFPQTGVNVTSDNAYDLYTTYKSDFVKYSTGLSLSLPQTSEDFLSSVKSGNVDYSITNLQNSEIDDVTRDSYLEDIDTSLEYTDPGSYEFNNLLEAKGKLSTLATVNLDRRENNLQYEHLKDKLGSFSKNLINVDIKPLSIYTANKANFSQVQEDLYSQLTVLKNNATNSEELNIASHETGSFDRIDFSTILPSSSNEEVTYLEGLPNTSDSHRLYDAHPTTEMFMEDQENVQYA